MIENIEVLCHSSIRMKAEKTIYIDPFQIKENRFDADMIFITHEHYDHFSKEDIEKIRKEDTIFILPETCEEKLKNLHFIPNHVVLVKPNENYEISGIKFSTIPAYNLNKPFHPKEKEWVGYLFAINGEKVYIAGDTDITEENKRVVCDIAMVPIGGTYTMTAEEAAELVNTIKPKIAVPIHYGSIVGTKKDAIKFKERLTDGIQCEIMI